MLEICESSLAECRFQEDPRENFKPSLKTIARSCASTLPHRERKRTGRDEGSTPRARTNPRSVNVAKIPHQSGILISLAKTRAFPRRVDHRDDLTISGVCRACKEQPGAEGMYRWISGETGGNGRKRTMKNLQFGSRCAPSARSSRFSTGDATGNSRGIVMRRIPAERINNLRLYACISARENFY